MPVFLKNQLCMGSTRKVLHIHLNLDALLYMQITFGHVILLGYALELFCFLAVVSVKKAICAFSTPNQLLLALAADRLLSFSFLI